MRCDQCIQEVTSPTKDRPKGWYRVVGDQRHWDLCSSVCLADFFDPLGPRRQDRWGTDVVIVYLTNPRRMSL